MRQLLATAMVLLLTNLGFQLYAQPWAQSQDISSTARTGADVVRSKSNTTNFSAFPTSGTGLLMVNFDADQYGQPKKGSYRYHWDFGDGSTATGSKASNTYTSPGIYTAVLTVSDGEKVMRSMRTIHVSPSTIENNCHTFLIDREGFEGSWGIWQDGGSDASRIMGPEYANSGRYSVRLRDNSSSTTITTSNLDLSTFEELTIDFSYITKSMDHSNEDFWLQLSTDGGKTYVSVEEWNLGDEFTNDIRKFDSVVIPGPFSPHTRLRFRCDASSNSDWVYIDDIALSGCSSSRTYTTVDQQLKPSAEKRTIEENPAKSSFRSLVK